MQSSQTGTRHKKLFGTDGIRGVAGEYPLDLRTVASIGAAVASYLGGQNGRAPRLVIGRDTRESGFSIETAFCAGAASAGARCESAGVITTPGVAFITGSDGYDGGIVISASHNPYQDNGIKVFLPDGRKLGEAAERAIEAAIHEGTPHLDGTAATRGENGKLHSIEELHREYLSHLRGHFPGLSLSGLKIAVDCANGAASGLAPELFSSFGADVHVIHADPNGTNINEDCGSLHLEHLRSAVIEQKADIGVGFDGDADRSLFIDENGEVVDGDATLWILANQMLSDGRLANRTVVSTVMSNVGLEIALERNGIRLERTDVGDKYVLEELLRSGSEIGGEQSGHIIFPNLSLVGDGMLTALSVLEVMSGKQAVLSELVAGFERYPQVLVNVRVKEKRPFAEVPRIAEAKAHLERELHGRGRLLLRYSGTEDLARVMIEGQNQAEIERQAHELARIIRESLG